MHHLDINSLVVRFDNNIILNNINLTVETGQIVSVLGLSGGGKTTLLRTIAGFIVPDSGHIKILDSTVACREHNLPVEQRNIGMVFQDFALFPHLSVKQNINFGIRALEAKKQVDKLEQLTELLNMQSFIDLYPHQLSGGQQQRVAIARAMAPEPKILLLDEPFSNLDTELRERLACELKGVLKKANITTIMISHNQLEAFAMADKIAVLDAGKIIQYDDAFDLYHKPANEFIADFIGEGCFIDGQVTAENSVLTALGVITESKPHGFDIGQDVKVFIRPDDIIHDDNSAMQAMVNEKIFRGAEFLYTLGLSNGERILSLVPSHHDHGIGESIGIRVEVEHLVAFAKN